MPASVSLRKDFSAEELRPLGKNAEERQSGAASVVAGGGFRRS